MSEDMRKMIDKVRNYGEKYDPQYVYDYINKMHKSGWEKRKFDDAEWVLNHKYFLLKDVNLDDPTIKWNFGQHPPVVSNYSKLETEIPPIVIGSNGYIIDGTHRAGGAKLKGDKTIKAFVGVNF
jgi:uncharacterized protein (UPF0248 family)